jgi:hypothetical protein
MQIKRQRERESRAGAAAEKAKNDLQYAFWDVTETIRETFCTTS